MRRYGKYQRSPKLDEQELLNAARKGDHDAFKEFIKKYEHKVARTVIGMLGNCSEAEDIGQETFIRFYRSLRRFRGDASVGTYLTRIAINLSLNEIKRRSRREKFFFLKPAYHPGNDILDNLPADRETGREEAKEIVQIGLRKLEPGFRAVLVLRLLHGYSTQETAEILDLPVGTVLSRLKRAQMKLKEILKPFWEVQNVSKKG